MSFSRIDNSYRVFEQVSASAFTFSSILAAISLRNFIGLLLMSKYNPARHQILDWSIYVRCLHFYSRRWPYSLFIWSIISSLSSPSDRFVGYSLYCSLTGQIYRGIEAVNTFLFTTSPDSVPFWSVCFGNWTCAVNYNKKTSTGSLTRDYKSTSPFQPVF